MSKTLVTSHKRLLNTDKTDKFTCFSKYSKGAGEMPQLVKMELPRTCD